MITIGELIIELSKYRHDGRVMILTPYGHPTFLEQVYQEDLGVLLTGRTEDTLDIITP